MAKYSLAEGTTPHLTFAEDLRLYRELGADGIGIAQSQKLTDPSEDLRAFRASGLSASICILGPNNLLPSRRHATPSDPTARTEIIYDAIQQIAPFEPSCCICGPGPLGEYELERGWAIGVAGLKKVARRASEFGIAIGLEPIHRSINADFSFLGDLPEAVAMCLDIDEPNVGIVFDVWHLWDTPDVEAHIRANIDLIVGVQVDDRREPTRVWNDRVLPGDGVSGVAHLLSVLKDAGYGGWLDLEVISDDSLHSEDPQDSLWQGSRRELAREGLGRMRSMWGGDADKGSVQRL